MIKRFFLALFEEFSEIRFAASSLAFSSLLSMIPFLIIVVVVLQSIIGLDKFYPKIELVMIGYLKEATGVTVGQYVKNALSQFQPRTLGLTGGLVLLLTSLSMIRTIDIAFHRIWKVKITTPLYSRIWLYWLILILAPVTLALYTGLRSFDYFNSLSQKVEHQFLLSLGTAAFLFLLYKVIPQVRVSFLAALIPALLAASALAAIQKSFLWFSLKIFKQNKIYGSLISFPIFLLWLLAVWYVVLTGVALSALLHKKILRRGESL